MSTFLQFHLLTTYGPSNPNRDDQGRPKEARVGGSLRLSSQSVKRALRESSFFEIDLKDKLGTRTKRLHEKLVEHLKSKEIAETEANTAADEVAGIFGKMEKSENVSSVTTLAFISPDEWKLAEELAEKIVSGDKLPNDKEMKKHVLQRADGAVDIAMFGRMLAGAPAFNRDAAVQVAHAFTTHTAIAQEDWFSAVDDLNKAENKPDSGHLGEIGFGSGVYYQYVCVNVDLLVKNLAGDRDLASKGAEALARAIAIATPKGKQNSFAHHPRAHYVLAERGTQAPRDLSGAFFDPVDTPYLENSVKVLEKTRADIDSAYGRGCDDDHTMRVGVTGTLDKIVHFAGAAVREAGCNPT
ncbi:MAG: type I-E CRISPR-associated protein Cas7/Cse4/CasC [Rhodobacteraceae bacterium]|nr:type I-E CRISPR-associated protein Cas7/Cse4/CasC [Paracoccaceae bacterium]